MQSPIGQLTLVATDTGISEVHFERERKTNSAKNDDHPLLKKCEKELTEYFAGKRKEFTVPLDLHGTDFQKKAWGALCAIPYGETRSYKQQAQKIKNVAAVRAVGAANGSNPVAIIVPCHRVIASNGHLHGYAGGLKIKQFLLQLEGIEVQSFKLSQPSLL
jgi:methylated-DNA-[protein]-cysteine S-methyltransferase